MEHLLAIVLGILGMLVSGRFVAAAYRDFAMAHVSHVKALRMFALEIIGYVFLFVVCAALVLTW
jgi:hypothetical protein